MTNSQRAAQVTEIFFKYHLDSKKLIKQIQKLCPDVQESSEWYLFTPLVFTRVNFPEVNFPTEYYVEGTDGKDEARNFMDSNVYNQLMEYAKENWRTFTDEQKEHVMFKYHQYHNISDAIRNGVDPSEVIVKKVKIM